MKRSILMILFLMMIVIGSHFSHLYPKATNERSIPSTDIVPMKSSLQTPAIPRAVIVLDPGHGGKEEGAKGWTTKVKEKEITLSIAKAAQDWLSHQGIKVYLTRMSDYQLASNLKTDLQLRAKFAGHPLIQASVFVSIHIDQFNRKVHGTKVYYSKQNPFPESSKELSQSIHDVLVKEIHSHPLEVHPHDFLVLKENVRPAALVEVGHLSHPAEEQKLIHPDYQKQAGIGIAKGIQSYLKLQPE